MSTDHSGSSTSKAAAEHRQKRRTEARQKVYLARSRGLTVKELREALGEHHGVASSMLSVLHREGQVARLTETRDRCHVYVSPLFVNRRDTQPYGGRAVERDFAIKQVEEIRRVLANRVGDPDLANGIAIRHIEQIVGRAPEGQ